MKTIISPEIALLPDEYELYQQEQDGTYYRIQNCVLNNPSTHLGSKLVTVNGDMYRVGEGMVDPRLHLYPVDFGWWPAPTAEVAAPKWSDARSAQEDAMTESKGTYTPGTALEEMREAIHPSRAELEAMLAELVTACEALVGLEVYDRLGSGDDYLEQWQSNELMAALEAMRAAIAKARGQR